MRNHPPSPIGKFQLDFFEAVPKIIVTQKETIFCFRVECFFCRIGNGGLGIQWGYWTETGAGGGG